MSEQLSSDWEARFQAGDHPWEEDTPWPGLVEFVQRFAEPGASVLDVGCGHGVNARTLAEAGFRVSAVDVSPTAIDRARSLDSAGRVDWSAQDLMQASFAERFAIVLDRGCLHSYADLAGRREFAARIAEFLQPEGIWISITGSADEGDSPERIAELRLPRLTLADLAAACEDRFEALEVRSCRYGTNPPLGFRAFVSVWRLRSG